MKLVSSVVISDVGDFPLRLSVPTLITSGGYLLPPDQPAYSPIDILIAGLEAQRLSLLVTNLLSFFDTHKLMYSDNLVTITLENNGYLQCLPIAAIKSLIVSDKDHGLLKLMRRNAPLTFKWMDI